MRAPFCVDVNNDDVGDVDVDISDDDDDVDVDIFDVVFAFLMHFISRADRGRNQIPTKIKTETEKISVHRPTSLLPSPSSSSSTMSHSPEKKEKVRRKVSQRKSFYSRQKKTFFPSFFKTCQENF